MKLDPKNFKFTSKEAAPQSVAPEDRDDFRSRVAKSLGSWKSGSRQGVIVLAGFVDLVGMIIVATLIAAIYPGFATIETLNVHIGVVLLAAGVLVVALEFAGHYKFNALLYPARRLPNLFMTWLIVFAIVIGSVFFLKHGEHLSRIWLGSWAIFGLLAAVIWRAIFGFLLRRLNSDGRYNRNAVLIGGGEAAARVISIIDNSQNSGYNLVGVFDDRDDDRVPPETKGLLKLGGIDDLVEFVRTSRVDTLIVTITAKAEDRLLQLLQKLWVLPVDIRLSAQAQKLPFMPRTYSYIGNLACLDLYDKPLGEWGPFFKTAMDKTIAAVMLLLLSPVMACIAIAIKLNSKGPVLFKQMRYGFNNELIEVFKFRSMYANQADVNASKLVSKGDPRVTSVGRFIRRTTLDELPQLFNVLNGTLSLVGPRPHATQAKAGTDLYENVVASYFARHKVKPGLTGWAQVNGWRGETDVAEKIERRVEHDLYYIENWSIGFDLYILARTPLALLNTENAY